MIKKFRQNDRIFDFAEKVSGNKSYNYAFLVDRTPNIGLKLKKLVQKYGSGTKNKQ